MNSSSDFFSTRAAHRAKFLHDAGWPNAASHAIGHDAGSRRYFRVARGGQTAILLESLPPGHKLETPGHRVADFVRIAGWVRAQNLHAPEIYAADIDNDFLLLEDFGDTSFKILLSQGGDAPALYGLAVDVLTRLRDADAAPLELSNYYASHIHTARRRVVDWFFPAVRHAKNPDGLAEEYLAIWDSIEKTLPPCPQGFLHIDYHVENLMWLSTEKNLARCGLLDFQGAKYGPQPYDLANLLEDPRHAIPADLRALLLDRFCADLPPAAADNFRAWYRVLATQFHCRVIGQYIRSALLHGKPRYLQFLPRVGEYLERGLADPLLRPLHSWFANQGVDFTAIPTIDPATVAGFIRTDAF